MARVAGKMAFITGGAQGLGEATARMLAREGAKVTVTDINGPGAADIADSINAEHGQGTAFAWQHDVTDGAAWEKVLKQAHDAMGGLNVLVNNAGIGSLGDVEAENYETFQHVMKVDVDSIFLGCKYALPLMRAHGLGSIVNISSIAGIVASGCRYNPGRASIAAVHQIRKRQSFVVASLSGHHQRSIGHRDSIARRRGKQIPVWIFQLCRPIFRLGPSAPVIGGSHNHELGRF